MAKKNRVQGQTDSKKIFVQGRKKSIRHVETEKKIRARRKFPITFLMVDPLFVIKLLKDSIISFFIFPPGKF